MRTDRRTVALAMLSGMTGIPQVAHETIGMPIVRPALAARVRGRRRLRADAVATRIETFLAGAETVTVRAGEVEEVWDGPAFAAEVTRRAVGR